MGTEPCNKDPTLIPLLRIPSLGRIGSTKLVLPKWQNIDILNRGIRVINEQGGYVVFLVLSEYSFIRDFRVLEWSPKVITTYEFL